MALGWALAGHLPRPAAVLAAADTFETELGRVTRVAVRVEPSWPRHATKANVVSRARDPAQSDPGWAQAT